MKNLFAFILFASMIACHSENIPIEETVRYTELVSPPAIVSLDTSVSTEEYESNSPMLPEQPKGNVSLYKSKIIKDGTISLLSRNITRSRKNLNALVKNANGYYASDETIKSKTRTLHSLSIRIPAHQFEKFLTSLDSGQDEITSREIQARDVTEDFIDLESGLKNKRTYLARYTELLSKAQTVKDILAIEENIRVLQEEMDSQTGRLRYLNDQVAYSTLQVKLLQETESAPLDSEKFLNRAFASFQNGWTSIVDFSLGIINAWPIVFTGLIMGIWIRRVIIRRKTAKKLAALS